MKGPAKRKRPKLAEDPAELRRRAELRLSGRQKKTCPNTTQADNERQIHELEVHQVELEMQNEELRDAREAMEALLEKYTDLYDFAPVGYLNLDRQGVICEANLACASLLGMARSALMNRRFGHFIAAADLPAFDAFLQKTFSSKVRQGRDVTLKMEGRPPMEVEMEAIAFESGEACRVAVTDITERKRGEADRLILNKLESTGILAGGIAHDFNNLLTVILLNLELAQSLDLSDQKLARYLEEAMEACSSASSLTAQLVTFAKGGAPVRKAMLLSGLIQESVRPALSGSNVRCEFSLAEDLWMAEVDAGQIGQVIRGMVLNAREAMPRGGVVFVRAENVVLGDQEELSLPAGEYVQVSIADEGVGMAKDVLSKIFDPYFSTKQRGDQKGMGLGLTICHTVVQKHGGAIAVKSEMGVGTTFDIYLPAARKLSGAEKASAPPGVPRHGKVLVMDDEQALRKVLGLMLTGLGHEVDLAEDGQMAIDVYKKAKSLGRHFDVVILDLTVREGMGGQETIQALLKVDPAVKAVAMSGYIQDPVIQEPERHGFKCALAKPFNIETLQEILSRVMGSKAAP
ncbi:MAG: ATP-binding protein [Verrucomicrobiota bacterium]|jgi:PAS domain S-box-containing protein